MLLGCVGLCLALPACGQQSIPDASQPGAPARGVAGAAGAAEPVPDPQLGAQMARARNSERQKELVADTEKLFLLAQQLRDEVAKSNKDELSVSVVKTSAQIEKLARSVKEKMRGD